MSSEDERHDLLIGFLEGELDDDERELVEEELEGSSDAKDRLDAYRSLSAALSELEPPEPSAQAKDRAYAAVMAAMAEDSAAPVEPVEAPPESLASSSGAPQQAPSAPAPAPRGQLLRFLSASAAAALVMVSATLYLGGLETPHHSKMALAPKKVAMEEEDQARRVETTGQAAPPAPLAAPAAPSAGGAGFAETSGARESESEDAAGKKVAKALALEELAKEERERQDQELLNLELAKNLERGSAQGAKRLAPRTAARMAGEPAPQDALTEGQETGKPKARPESVTPATPPAGPSEGPRPELKGFGRQPRDNAKAELDAPDAELAEDESRKGARRGRKKLRGGQGGAKRKKGKEIPPAPRRRANGDVKPQALGPGSDGTPRQGGLSPEADADSGMGGGGGGGSAPGAGDGSGQPKGAKSKDKAREPRRPQPERSLGGGRDREAEERLRLRSRGVRPAANELQPAWIVTRGRERVLYVMEGNKLTQAPFPKAPARAPSAKSGDPSAQHLEVTALEVQRRALATKRKAVDLRVLERREDLLAIAKLELASEAKPRAGRSDDAPQSDGAPRGGGAAPGGEAGGKEGEKPKSTGGEEAPAEASPTRPRASPTPSQPLAGKRALPPPPPGRDRAEALLRLLGVIEGRRPSRSELRRAVRDTERRHVEARRRR
jgi:hypothetical protein